MLIYRIYLIFSLQDVRYLAPYLEEVIRERKEREEWMKK